MWRSTHLEITQDKPLKYVSSLIKPAPCQFRWSAFFFYLPCPFCVRPVCEPMKYVYSIFWELLIYSFQGHNLLTRFEVLIATEFRWSLILFVYPQEPLSSWQSTDSIMVFTVYQYYHEILLLLCSYDSTWPSFFLRNAFFQMIHSLLLICL